MILTPPFVSGKHKKDKNFIKSGIAQGIKQGVIQGIKQGSAQGLEQGVKQSRSEAGKKIARKMPALGLTVDVISEATGLSLQEIRTITASEKTP